jgi:hypothetical protein
MRIHAKLSPEIQWFFRDFFTEKAGEKFKSSSLRFQGEFEVKNLKQNS